MPGRRLIGRAALILGLDIGLPWPNAALLLLHIPLPKGSMTLVIIDFTNRLQRRSLGPTEEEKYIQASTRYMHTLENTRTEPYSRPLTLKLPDRLPLSFPCTFAAAASFPLCLAACAIITRPPHRRRALLECRLELRLELR